MQLNKKNTCGAPKPLLRKISSSQSCNDFIFVVFKSDCLLAR